MFGKWLRAVCDIAVDGDPVIQRMRENAARDEAARTPEAPAVITLTDARDLDHARREDLLDLQDARFPSGLYVPKARTGYGWYVVYEASGRPCLKHLDRDVGVELLTERMKR